MSEIIEVIGGVLWQWDTGRKVKITPKEGMPVDEVHFERPGEDTAAVVEPYMDGEDLVADIPNILLQSWQKIIVYAVGPLEIGERTFCGRTLVVNPRQKPDDYVYTETEVRTWEALDERINALADKSQTKRIEMQDTDTAAELQPNSLYVFPEMSELSLTFAEPEDTSIVNEYHVIFISGATATTLVLPDEIRVGSFTVEANQVYELSILEGNLAYQSWDYDTEAA